MSIFTQAPAFARGEIAPELFPRADLAWHRLGLRALRNRFVSETGGAPRRPGTMLVDERRYPDKQSIGIDFIFSTVTGDTYTLEFGDQYMEVIRGGARVTEPTKAVTMATAAATCVITAPGHGFVVGDHILVWGIYGMFQLNNRRLRVRAVVDVNRFSVEDLDGVAINSTPYGGYYSPGALPGGFVARVYMIPTPYLEADLDKLGHAQSFDVMTLVHPKYEPRELSRTAHTAWTLSVITFASKVAAPLECFITGYTAGGTEFFKYTVTALDDTTGEESPIAPGQARVISGITNAVPAVVTVVGAHTYQTGDRIKIDSLVLGMIQVRDREFTITVTGASTFQLDGVDSTAYGVWTSGGNTRVISGASHLTAALPPSGTNPIKVGFRLVTNAHFYRVYRFLNGRMGFVGIVELPAGAHSSLFGYLVDEGAAPDTDDGPPILRNPFVGVGNYPSVVAFHQQRRLFAGTDNDPQGIECSQIGHFSNFTKHEPIRDGDAFRIPLASGEVNPIRHILSLRRAVVLSGASENSLEGDEAGTITPTQVNARPYSYEGSSFLRPLKCGPVVVYNQARGGIVRDLAYDFGADGYKGLNRSLPSRHLLEGYTLVDWAYQKVPHSIIWSVRDDGALLGLTYIPEQEMFAWHRHDTDGSFERVVCVPEGDGGTFQERTLGGKTTGRVDGTYLFTKRTINGKVRRFIERLDRGVVDETDTTGFKYSDSSLSYDGWNKGTTTMVLSGGVDYTPAETLTLTASAPTFTPFDQEVDAGAANYTEIWLEDPATGEVIRCRPVLVLSETVMTVHPDRTVPVGNRNTATWARAIRRVWGLGHLEAKEVAVLGDGFVVASPYNPKYPKLTVVRGGIVLPGSPRAVIHAGLPYVSDLETLNIEIPEGQSLAGKPKRVGNIGVHVHQSCGAIWAGQRPKNDNGYTVVGMQEFKDGISNENPDKPGPLRSEFIEVPVASNWDTYGRALVRVIDPVPGAILSTVLSAITK